MPRSKIFRSGLVLTFAILATSFFSVRPAAATVIYEISPWYHARGYSITALEGIRRRLPELKALGVDVLWIQPLSPSHGPGQGYDVTDHFSLSSIYGSEAELKRLVSEAHELGMKVMLDMVLNHTSIHHPYAADVIARGEGSRHYPLFQHVIDRSVPYSEHMKARTVGKSTFVVYFWDELVNLDYTRPEARQYALDVVTHWIEKFDVDGFRFDASWAPSARWPDFYPSLARKIRALKPDAVLLAEDKTAYPARLEGTGHPHLRGSEFDFAYDWNASDPDWISKWAFQSGDEEGDSLFRMKDPRAAAKAFLEGLKHGESMDVRPIRYLQNNDTPSFTSKHGPKQTRFATILQFMLPGAPVISYGQEVGSHYEQWKLPAFDPDATIRSVNPVEWDFHRRLIAFRKATPVLRDGTLEVARLEGSTVVLRIRKGAERVEIRADFRNRSVEYGGVPIEKMLAAPTSGSLPL